MPEKMIHVVGERRTNTYEFLRVAASRALELARLGEQQFFYDTMISLAFSAFTFEAFLNHLGEKKVKNWGYLERLTPSEKMQVVILELKVDADFGVRPWQTIKPLFKFRNRIAHGKTDIRMVDEIVPESKVDVVKYKKTDWENYCQIANAERALEDVLAIAEILNEKAMPYDSPFGVAGDGAFTQSLVG